MMLTSHADSLGMIQQRITTLTGAGTSHTWADVEERWCSVSVLSADARARWKQQLSEEITHLVKFRDEVTFPIDWRLQWDGRVLTPVKAAGVTKTRSFTMLHMREELEESDDELPEDGSGESGL